MAQQQNGFRVKCSNCGAGCGKGAQRCTSCGEMFSDTVRKIGINEELSPLQRQQTSAPAAKSRRGLSVVALIIVGALAALAISSSNTASQAQLAATQSALQAQNAQASATAVSLTATQSAVYSNGTATAVANASAEEQQAAQVSADATAQAQANAVATAQADAAQANANALAAQRALDAEHEAQTQTAIANAQATADAQEAINAQATADAQAILDQAATAAAAPTQTPAPAATRTPAPAKPFKNWYQMSWTPSTAQDGNGHTRVKGVVSLPGAYRYDLSSMGLRLVGDPNGDKKPGANAFWDLSNGRHVLQLVQFKNGGVAVVSETAFVVADGQTTIVTFTGK